MKAINANVTRGLNVGCVVETCDNSGAKMLKIFNVMGLKTTHGRIGAAGVSDMVMCSVIKGRTDMRKQVVLAIIVRQRKEYRRPDGTRIKFEDNAAIITDEEGMPKGTEIKGPIAKEVVERFSAIGKIASTVV